MPVRRRAAGVSVRSPVGRQVILPPLRGEHLHDGDVVGERRCQLECSLGSSVPSPNRHDHMRRRQWPEIDRPCERDLPVEHVVVAAYSVEEGAQAEDQDDA